MKLPTPTPDELRVELRQTLLDLCQDIYLLACLLDQNENRPGLRGSRTAQAALMKRLTDYIEYHAKDVVTVSEALVSHEA